MPVPRESIRRCLNIPLAPAFLQTRGRVETEAAIRTVVRSVRFELLDDLCALRLLGPDMSYLEADPYLEESLRKLDATLMWDKVASFARWTGRFDLCLEDSRTGYLIAQHLERQGWVGDVVLIHLDDHRDMMPTLLDCSGPHLIDPTSCTVFDPNLPEDWESAIASGVVSIGNFITPFYYSGRNVHVRHLANSISDGKLHSVSRSPVRYALIPDKEFAGIALSDTPTTDCAGTYLAGSHVGALLANLPEGAVLLHIDLDYFINDFNGAGRGADYIPDPSLQINATRKMDSFFSEIHRSAPIIDRWLVAISPGFCSGYHWEWLLCELDRRIKEFEDERRA